MNHEIQKHKNLNIIFISLTVVVVVLTLYVAFIQRGATWLETMKVGGAQNMNLVQQLYDSDAYKTQQKQAIQQVLSSMNEPVDTTTQKTAPTNTITKAKMDAIKKSGYIKGDKNSRITILEYSEFLCPYCKRQSDNKVLDQLLEKYPKEVNRMFRHFIVHPQAKIIGEGMECVGELGGTDKFFEYEFKAFDITDQTDAGVIALAKELGINETKITNCLEDEKYSKLMETMSDEGRTLFGVSGTPGNVIVDNEKGTYTLIAGAYPVEKFIEVIDAILASK